MTEFLASYQAGLDALTLPERVPERYQLVSALGHSPESGTFLLRRRQDGALFVLRTDGGGQDLAGEFQLLERLPKGLAPEPVDFFEEGGVQYLIRTYIPGKSLEEVWEPDKDFDRWADLGARLCGLLDQLHRLDPPVVHRDIKPENIILSPEGKPYLIDFGIARSVKPERETDTVHLGTRTTAAPEQYGFAQSDQRTDLYALGVTLRWMVTGSYRPEALEDSACPVRVKRFLRRAAAFDPADRYPSASAMADVLRVFPRRTRDLRGRVVSFWLGVAAALLCVAVAAWFPRSRAASGIDFGSPLLEAAVRSELDKPEGTVTREDLKEVRRLAVVGQTLLGKEQDYQYDMSIRVDGVDLRDAPKGDIMDLSLLAEMPNLTTLYMCCQAVSDISPLKGLPIQELYLVDNNIRDFSPLEGLPDVRVLQIGKNPAEDLTPLASLKCLRKLNLSGLRAPESLSPLRELPLEYLCMYNLEPQDGDWSVLPTLGKLDFLWMDGASPASIAVLPECRNVTNMILWKYEAENLWSLPAMPQLEALSVSQSVLSCEGVQRQKNLERFEFCYRGEIDLSPIAELKNLSDLYLDGSIPPDFRPLMECGTLSRVGVHPEEFAAAIEAECPGHTFEVVLN